MYVLVTQRIYYGFTALHSTSFSRLSTCIVLQLLQRNTKERRESRDATNTIAGYPRGTITSQVCSVSCLVYPCGCNGL